MQQVAADQRNEEDRRADRVLEWAEDAVYLGIAVLLVVSSAVLFVAVDELLEVFDELSSDPIVEVLDTLLLVFILVELLSAVRRTISQRQLVAEIVDHHRVPPAVDRDDETADSLLVLGADPGARAGPRGPCGSHPHVVLVVIPLPLQGQPSPPSEPPAGPPATSSRHRRRFVRSSSGSARAHARTELESNGLATST